MPYCQHCGGEMSVLPEIAAAEAAEPVEVVLARIEADRAIQVARIEASAQRAELATAETIAETQADAQVDAAEAVAEIMTAEPEPGEESAAEPIVIDAPESIADIEPDDAPPPADDSHSPHEPHERAKPKGLGFW